MHEIIANRLATLRNLTLVFYGTGLKFIPLRKPGGETASHIGLFVKLEIKTLRHKQASSSGRCKQDLEKSMQKFSLSTVPEICRFSESMEAPVAIDHNDEGVDQGITPQLASNNSANGGHLISNRPPQLFRQGGINECTVEIHAENNTGDPDSDTEL